MDPADICSAEDARRIVEERGLSHVKVGVFDVDGVLRGKYMSRDKFFSALGGGFGFCDVVLGWDSNDQLYDNASYTGWHTAYPDAPVRIVPASCRSLPLEDDMLFFLCEFDQHAEAVCPRAALRRVLDRADAAGYRPQAAFEYEFFVFDETPQSVRAKGYRDLRPLTPGNFGYSVLRNSVHAEMHHDFLALCRDMRFDLESLHTETGPGVIEAAITVTEAGEAADRAALFKTFTKVFAQRRNLMATFMAKWSMDYPGAGGHIHLSLRRHDGTSAFHDEAQPHGIADEMRWFLGGQQRLMPDLLALVAPTVNAYTRLIPGFWAPTDATWGVENRTCALRVIPGSAKAQRVEYRVAAADANPYLALAAALLSGLHGIAHRLEPEPAVEGNAYGRPWPRQLALPPTLAEAAQRLRRSAVARDWLGDAFVEHFAASREWEEREFRRHVTDWELRRYFEII